ncbi:dicarboxylate/amino acid:cation symporter [Pannus brasiliensis CCIBt3594]|uniref:Dicarboxylate/amino acid:cation symporter n=1 Tax=Pannus brasiliensis CCIBt3594 TaxID=1427578 RepID=A0AAW9QG68_9CHRO
MTLSTLILIALGLGIVFGSGLHGFFPAAIGPLDRYLLDPTGRAFLRLIQFVVVPIVFSSLILGLTRVQNATRVGRYLVKLLSGYVLTSSLALGIGMGMALLLQPGAGMAGFSETVAVKSVAPVSPIDWLVSLIPVNPIAALGSGNLLQVIVAGVLFSAGIASAGEKARPFVDFLESLYVISEKILSVVLYVAPVGVFALIASVIATQGLELVARLFFYVFGLFLSSALMIGFYTLVLWFLKAKPARFYSFLAESLSLAFGTASSNAALPVVLRDIQEYGLPEEIASFAIPLGTVLKRDGSAILQGFNALFIAQVYGVPLTPSLVLAIALSGLLVSFSTPGVPGSALITMTTVLSAAGLPLEGVALVAGVDRLTDGFKTVLNVVGNTVNAIFLNAWEERETGDRFFPREDRSIAESSEN